MSIPDWLVSFPGAVTVCGLDGTILFMNEASCRTFAARGGAALVGQNVLDCHPEPARSRLAALLEAGGTNAYTIEKHGVHKLIHQSPWYRDGVRAGMVELSLVLPAGLPMPHFVRG